MKKVPVDLADWDGLRKGSKKGFVLLLVGLSWWVTQATKKKDKNMASTAIHEVLFVVRQLAAKAPENDESVLRKRARGPEPRRASLKRLLHTFVDLQ